MASTDTDSRRRFLAMSVLGSGWLLAGCGTQATGAGRHAGARSSPIESLMREHGILKRILLIYGEGVRRLDANKDVSPHALSDAALIIRSVIEDHHEMTEESYIFPRFLKANTMVELVNMLILQHASGRKLTERTLSLSKHSALKNPDERRALADSLRQFIRMFSPHEAREDTVLYPAFKKLISTREYDALGEEVEKQERELFGADGFEKTACKVAALEEMFGVPALSACVS